MPSPSERLLLVIADDFGIGPNTTTGILQLASQGIVTGSVVLVNSPYAEEATRRWRQLGSPLELGWHPNLTLDAPIADPGRVPTLVRADGTFWPLGSFLQRWFLGRLDPNEIRLELELQLRRFMELVGRLPLFVNSHQHVAVFSPVGDILLDVLSKLPTRPYIRRIQEPWRVIKNVSGARFKRIVLGWLGRRLSRSQETRGFPGNDWLAGITTPRYVEHEDFFVRWLRAMPGKNVELMCHPGRLDSTLVGRDCTEASGLVQQRVNELRWLRESSFRDAVDEAGFHLVSPSEFLFGRSAITLAA